MVLPTLQQVMTITVQPETKVMAETDITPVASITGFIIIPPPIPLIVPIVQAKNVMRMQIINNPIIFLALSTAFDKMCQYFL